MWVEAMPYSGEFEAWSFVISLSVILVLSERQSARKKCAAPWTRPKISTAQRCSATDPAQVKRGSSGTGPSISFDLGGMKSYRSIGKPFLMHIQSWLLFGHSNPVHDYLPGTTKIGFVSRLFNFGAWNTKKPSCRQNSSFIRCICFGLGIFFLQMLNETASANKTLRYVGRDWVVKRWKEFGPKHTHTHRHSKQILILQGTHMYVPPVSRKPLAKYPRFYLLSWAVSVHDHILCIYQQNPNRYL